jgi:hypothetical protein
MIKMWSYKNFTITVVMLVHKSLASRVKAHYKGVKNVVTLYNFPGVSMFELQPW